MLTEEQIAALRPKWNDYPERRVVVPVYPEARQKRRLKASEQAGLAPEAPGAIPTNAGNPQGITKLWSIHLYSNIPGTAIQRGSPAFAGPALIHSLCGIIRPTDAAGTVYPAQIAYSTSPYTDTDAGASSIKIQGTHLWTSADPYANSASAIPFDTGLITPITPLQNLIPIGIYVTLDRFYLGVRIEGLAAGFSTASIVIRVIENAPPESISWV